MPAPRRPSLHALARNMAETGLASRQEGPSRQEGSGLSTQQPRVSDDGIRIHPHVFSVPFKVSKQTDIRKQLRKWRNLDKGSKEQDQVAEQFSEKLTHSRELLLTSLETPAISDAHTAVSQAFEGYASQLLGLFHTAKSGESSETTLQLRPYVRDAVIFEWRDVLLTSQSIAVPDAVFELASAVIAVSAWRLRRAAHLCGDARAGIDSAHSSQAYKLILLAAGGFKFVQESCSPLLEATCPSADCTSQAASALMHICLADAQAITTLRAMAKSNAPSLIAGLAAETAAMYRSSVEAAAQAPFAHQAAKARQYGEYKAAVFRSYACCFAGLANLKDGQAGQAVRLLEESKKDAQRALPLAAAYNKSEPSTPAADHAEFDRDLSICVDSAWKRAQKENDHVYYQRPPQDLPPLPEPRRLVNATPLQLPEPADGAREIAGLNILGSPASNGRPAEAPKEAAVPSGAPGAPAAAASTPAGHSCAEASASADAPPKAACWRWLLVVVAMPVLAVISVVGLIVWLVLLPVKVICCPIGCLIQIMADVVENLLKAPFKAILWASGKPYKAQKVQDAERQKS